jgi:uncharacterized membrane protein YedE/YeeE
VTGAARRDIVWAGLSGLLFAVGLVFGGMTDPARVQGFLDLFGAWDPTLAFVMGGALLVYGLLIRTVRRPPEPATRVIDARLVGGAALFGVGWGLAGYCPGPALTAVAVGGPGTVLFVVAMLGGFVAQRLVGGRA